MNGSMGNMAFGASETADSEHIMSLKTVQSMLPLVQHIANDIVQCQVVVDKAQPEQDRLESLKRSLAWPARQRRYELFEQMNAASQKIAAAAEELGELGVVLLDPRTGRVGFPTLVNNRRAFFSWHPGEEGLNSWHFAEESVFRPIPQAWLKELSLVGKE